MLGTEGKIPTEIRKNTFFEETFLTRWKQIHNNHNANRETVEETFVER
jgi:hypothetical protein